METGNKHDSVGKGMAPVVFECYIDSLKELSELPELRKIISACAPEYILHHIEQEITAFLSENTGIYEFNAAGFANFRLAQIKGKIDDYIEETIQILCSRSKYYDILDSLREYANSPSSTQGNINIIDELYINAASTGIDESGCTLELILELLPKKIIVLLPEYFPYMNFVDSLQYIFGDRVVLKTI